MTNDCTNAKRAMQAIEIYAIVNGCDDDSALVNLLADLMHLFPLAYATAARVASVHYDAEKEELD
jgi:hypothetical protein